MTTYRPVRNRPTWVSYFQISAYGFLLYSLGVSLTFLRDEEGITRQIASLHGTALALGAAAGAVLMPRFTRRFGRGPMLRVGSVGIFVGTLFVISGWGFAVTMFATFFFAFFGMMSVVGVNAFITEFQGPAGPASLTEGNALASFGTLLGPAVIGAAIGIGWSWRIGAVVAMAWLVVVELWRGRNTEVYDAATGHPENEPGHDPGGKLPRRFWMYWVVGGFIVGAEFILVYFATDYMRDHGGLGTAAAVASVVTVAGGMTIGRLIGSRIVEHVDADKVLLFSIATMFFGFAVVWLTTNPVLMLAAMTVTGLGLGPLWPLGVTRTVQSSDGHADRASSRISIASAVASGVLPFLVATIADAFSIQVAMLSVPCLLVVAFVLVWLHPATSNDQDNAQPEYA